MNSKFSLFLSMILTAVLTSCLDGGGGGGGGGGGSSSSGKWFGTSYAIENSIRELADDDNPSWTGANYDSNNNVEELWSQDGTSYAFEDVSAYNASIMQTGADSDFYRFDVPGQTGTEYVIKYDGYYASFDLWADDNSNGSVQAGEVRARLSVGKTASSPPSSTRPSSQYDYSKIASGTYTGVTFSQGDLTDATAYTSMDGSGGCANTITFAATATGNISGTICNTASTNFTLDTSNNFEDPTGNATSVIAGNHGTYVGGDGTNGVIAVVASPDGGAVVVITCINNASCEGAFSSIF